MKPLLAAAAAFLVCLSPGAAAGGQAAAQATAPTMRVVDVPLHGERTLAAARVGRFDLVGLHWQGNGTVEFRTHRLDGSWSAWRAAAPEAGDLPDPGSAEARRAGSWRLGSPWWVGPSDRIEYKLHGTVGRLRAFLVSSPVGPAHGRSLASAGPIQA